MLKAGPEPAHPALDARSLRRSARLCAANPFPEGRRGNSAPLRTRTDGAGGGCTGAGGSRRSPPAALGPPGESADLKHGVLGCFGKKVELEFVFPTAAGNGWKGELLL